MNFTRAKTAIKFAFNLTRAIIVENRGYDPRDFGCQIAMLSLDHGKIIRIYDTNVLQDHVKHKDPVSVAVNTIESPEGDFNEDMIDQVDHTYPIIIDVNTGVILDGEHRYLKAIKLSRATIMVHYVDATELPYVENSGKLKIKVKNF